MRDNLTAERHTRATLIFKCGATANYDAEYFAGAKMLSIAAVYIDRESVIKVHIELEPFPFDVRDVVNTMAGCELFLK